MCTIAPKRDFYDAYSDPNFRYGKVLAVADKLKSCDKVLLAKSGNDFYKIGFACDGKEFLHFKFGDMMTREKLVFTPTRVNTLEELRKERFDFLLTKEEAKVLLNTQHQRSSYEKESFEVIDLLLN